jgi:hypothetical protein
MSGVVSIKSGSEQDLLAAVATVGPIAVAVDASSNGFRVIAKIYRAISYSSQFVASKLTLYLRPLLPIP